MESLARPLNAAALRAAAVILLLCIFGTLPWTQCLSAGVLVAVADLVIAAVRRRRAARSPSPDDLVARRTAELNESVTRLAGQAREYHLALQAMRRRAQQLQQETDELRRRHDESMAALRRQTDAHGAHVERLTAEFEDHRERLAQEQHESLAGLAGGIAGEFHEALHTIAGTVSLLLARVDLPAEAAARLATVRTAVLTASRRAAQLDEYARGGRIGSLRELVDLEELLADTAALTQRRLGADVAITSQVVGRPFALGEAAELREVILALVEHTASAMTGGGRIRLAAEANDGGVCVTLADTGLPLDDDAVRRCFIPYASPGGGSGGGLTLAWCRATLRRHGGELHAGRTPRFTLTLPAADLSMTSAGQAA